MLLKTPPLHTVASSPVQEKTFVRLQKSHAPALAAYAESLKSPHLNGRLPYLCLGCQVGNGDVRQQMVGFAAYPLYQLAAEELLGTQLVLQAYHPNAYEEGADPGPGGVVGIKKLGGRSLAGSDISASTAHKMWLWVDKNEPAYLPESDAPEALWQLATQRCADGLAYLKSLGNLPKTPWAYPPALAASLHTLLGVHALQKLVAAKLGHNVVLLDATRLMAADQLSWEAL
ncbi:MAG TPA: hypothetical protein VHP58_02270 [Alphaproteobacteria bacterium]|nr:hypothetical protein [Alphaproteobacteria bacterium]